MQVRWKKLLVTAILWLTTEIVLNCVGIDDLADYSEYLEKTVISTRIEQIMFIA